MGIKAFLSKPIAAITVAKMAKWKNNAAKAQQDLLIKLLNQAKNTAFGKDHHFEHISSYQEYKKHVPIHDYEDLRKYIDRAVAGEKDVLWPAKPLYFAKTSGTTSGVKYIPISKQSMPEHIKAAKNALLCYIHETGKTDFLDGKLIFLQGSPELEKKSGISFGRLSGIVANHVPSYLQRNRLPSYKVNCIDDWEEKIDAIVAETIDQDMRLISGIPPWCQMYFDRLISNIPVMSNFTMVNQNANVFVIPETIQQSNQPNVLNVRLYSAEAMGAKIVYLFKKVLVEMK